MTTITATGANWTRSVTFQSNSAKQERDVSSERTTKDGNTVSRQAKITALPDGGLSIQGTRTGADGATKTIDKSFTQDQVANFKQHLHDLGEKLAENPKTLDNGRVLDGNRLLKIDTTA